MRKRPLILIACVFLAGIVCNRHSQIGGIVAVLLVVLRELWIGKQTKRILKSAGRSILLLSAFLIGILHMQQEMKFRAAYMSKIEDGTRVTVWGELIKMEPTEYGNRGILSDCYIEFGQGIIPCNDIMVYTSNDQFQIGQIHKISGKVNMFSRARNEGNFDSEVYYQSLKIDFAIEEEESILLGRDRTSVEDFLLLLRQKLYVIYGACMSQKTAGFYQAMILGDKTSLDTEIKDLFLIGGISHILAISGLHVSILGRGIYRILRRGGIGFMMAGLCGGSLLILYCLMVGGSVSTIRAVGMMLLFFLAQWLGRSYDMLNALAGMVLVLLWENPFLLENSSFWFSVTAIIGVGAVGKQLSQMNEGKIPLFSDLWMSFGITLATLPVTAWSYFEVPVYSVLVNFVVLPFLTPVFVLAVVGGMLGIWGVSQQVLEVFFQPCQWLLSFYEGICSMVSRLPYASIICGKPDVWQVMIYYFALLMGMFFMSVMKKREKRNRKLVFLLMSLICGLCIFSPKEGKFEITFLDVGQGDGIYMSGGDGSTYFIDGGSSNVEGVGEYRILPFLKSKGIRKIDYWFVSHCDTDHISGLYEIIEKGYKIEHIVLHEQCSDDENKEKLLSLARKFGIKVISMKAGQRIQSPNMVIVCLGPDKTVGETNTDRNESSMVLQVEWKPAEREKGFTALFAGDISIETENELCRSGVLKRVDLVKANHHGSNYSNGENWLTTIQSTYAVISCSATNRYGHPGEDAIRRMEAMEIRIFYTMENGQITFPLIQ